MKRVLQELGEGCGTRFEYECYDLGHLYNLAYLLDEKLVEPPLFLQTVFGILGGMGTDAELLSYVKATADRLFGRENYQWSLGSAPDGTRCGSPPWRRFWSANVLMGLEDSLYLSKGVLATSSAEQVKKVRVILEELSFEIATPDEVRKRLRLKGADQVAFSSSDGGVPPASHDFSCGHRDRDRDLHFVVGCFLGSLTVANSTSSSTLKMTFTLRNDGSVYFPSRAETATFEPMLKHYIGVTQLLVTIPAASIAFGGGSGSQVSRYSSRDCDCQTAIGMECLLRGALLCVVAVAVR